MGGLVLLDDYREGLNVRSITERLIQLGHDATLVSKTIAALLRENRNLGMVELCTSALRRLEESQPKAKRQRLAKARRRLHSGTEEAGFVRTLRLVVRNDSK